MKILDKFFYICVSDKDAHNPASYNEALNRRDYASAAPLLRAAIAKDDLRAMGAYAAMCALGYGVEKNHEEAYCWFLQAANKGDIRSQVALGMCLAGGVGAPINRQEAVYWLFRAGKAGNLQAIEVLGALVDKDHSLVGKDFSEDEVIALMYTYQKAKKGAPSSSAVH